MDFEKLYTVEDVAEYTGLTSRTIRNYLKNGTLSGRKVGGQWRFTMKNIANLIDSSTASGDIIASDDQFAHDFISGINTEVAGELQTLMVSDYYCPNAERAERLHEEFSTLYASSHDTDGKYLYYYHKPEQRARYIFCGAPELLGSYVERLKGVWQDLHRPQRQFSGRSANYLAGREDYPEEFFEYLYRDFCLSPDAAIADIGSGIGTMSGHFLGRGNLVYCIEPNEEMKAISDRQWGGYANYRSYLRTAEDTRLPTNSVD